MDGNGSPSVGAQVTSAGEQGAEDESAAPARLLLGQEDESASAGKELEEQHDPAILKTTDVTSTLAGLAKAVSATNKGSCGATETYRSSSLVPHKVSREVSRYPADPFDPNYVDIDTGNMRCAVAQVGPKQAAADLADPWHRRSCAA